MGAVDECFSEVKLAASFEMLGERAKNSFESALADPALESSMAGLIRRISTREILPRGSGAQHPKHTVHDVARIAKRATTSILNRRFFVGK